MRNKHRQLSFLHIRFLFLYVLLQASRAGTDSPSVASAGGFQSSFRQYLDASVLRQHQYRRCFLAGSEQEQQGRLLEASDGLPAHQPTSACCASDFGRHGYWEECAAASALQQCQAKHLLPERMVWIVKSSERVLRLRGGSQSRTARNAGGHEPKHQNAQSRKRQRTRECQL